MGRSKRGTIDVRCPHCGASGVFWGINEAPVPGKGVVCWTCQGEGFLSVTYNPDLDHDVFIELKVLEGIERVYANVYGDDRDPFVTYQEFLQGKRPTKPKTSKK